MSVKYEQPLQPLEGATFTFSCHKGVSCFTNCCRNVKLVLTPYDILRIKKRLNLNSSDFLASFTYGEMNGEDGFPLVYLSMNENDEKTCRFVTAQGCSIYEDRPSACRVYPLGRAVTGNKAVPRLIERYFLVREAHCKGFEEAREWTIAEWLLNEGLTEYYHHNDAWMAIVTAARSQPAIRMTDKTREMVFMASYNLDSFRRFILESSFFRRFDVPDEEKQIVKEDDVALYRFALRWMRFFLLGERFLFSIIK